MAGGAVKNRSGRIPHANRATLGVKSREFGRVLLDPIEPHLNP